MKTWFWLIPVGLIVYAFSGRNGQPGINAKTNTKTQTGGNAVSDLLNRIPTVTPGVQSYKNSAVETANAVGASVNSASALIKSLFNLNGARQLPDNSLNPPDAGIATYSVPRFDINADLPAASVVNSPSVDIADTFGPSFSEADFGLVYDSPIAY